MDSGIEPYNVWAEDDVGSTEVGKVASTTAADGSESLTGANLDMEETSISGTTGEGSLSSSFTLVHRHEALEESEKDTAEAHATVEETTLIERTISTPPLSGTKDNKTGRPRLPLVGLYQGLGRLQAYSAMAFGTFGIIHLVPPILASVGGVDLANKALIWGRVYYQTYGVEQVLVYGSLGVHLGTSLCRFAVRMVWKAKALIVGEDRSLSKQIKTTTTTTTTAISTESTVTSVTSSTGKTNGGVHGGSGGGSAPGLLSFHRVTGWLLAPFVLAHMDQMRMVPLRILGDSSMLDYSYITFLYRMRRPVPYALLVGLMAYHMFSGAPVAFNMMLPKGSERRIKTQELVQSKKTRMVVAGVVSSTMLVGVIRIMMAKGPIPMAKLYRSLHVLG